LAKRLPPTPDIQREAVATRRHPLRCDGRDNRIVQQRNDESLNPRARFVLGTLIKVRAGCRRR
jgi:hypothetical protein